MFSAINKPKNKYKEYKRKQLSIFGLGFRFWIFSGTGDWTQDLHNKLHSNLVYFFPFEAWSCSVCKLPRVRSNSESSHLSLPQSWEYRVEIKTIYIFPHLGKISVGFLLFHLICMSNLLQVINHIIRSFSSMCYTDILESVYEY